MNHLKKSVYLTSFTVFSGDIKKKVVIMTSQQDIFRAFFCSSPPTLNLKKNPVNQVNQPMKIFWPDLCQPDVMFVNFRLS